ncbi:MAG TPA: hypothetical protein PK357_00845 [Candidatus Pacearchaeota archaeon]|nr:hypothetical protein [Candidatus Pacearchaeota archaeon]
MNKKIFINFGIIFLIGILSINFIIAESSYCCERLASGQWCQNAPQGQCATGINPFSNQQYTTPVATSCQLTSYCKLGTCVDSKSGTCTANTPLTVCNNRGGVWKAEEVGDLPECQLGCCLLGDSAAFTTQVQCKKLSSDYGLTTNYRADITNELECIASITSDEIGACVFEEEYQTTCRMISQKDCSEINGGEFHSGFLCSAQQLATNCGPRGGTLCHQESVYFLDTCGNIANIYDFSKLNDNNYWTYIQEPSCDNGMGNKNSKTCGSCDYFSGSVCTIYQRGETIKPDYGDYFCGSLDCKEVGKLHGETWCEENSITSVKGQNLPGSRYYRFMCYNGEVSIEPCSEFRNEICIEDEVNDFSVAGCVLNKWQDCVSQTNKTECENTYLRDCKWISGYSVLKNEDGENLAFTETEDNKIPGTCVPKYAPGFDFYAETGNGAEVCSLGTQACVVRYEIGILASKKKLSQKDWDEKMGKCVENCYCIPGYTSGKAKDKYENNKPSWHPKSYDEWVKLANEICTAFGDCGTKKNYLGGSGDIKEIFTSEFTK